MSNEEIEMMRKTCMAYEAKLIELMGEDAFHAFATELAREFFADAICQMADGDFKETILDNQEFMDIKPQDCEHCAHCIPAGFVSFCELTSCDFKSIGGDT